MRRRQQLSGSILTTILDPAVEQLASSLAAVGELVKGVQDDQWFDPTPCTDWTVHALVSHIVGMNLVFAALMRDQPPPERGIDRLGEDPQRAYHASSSVLIAAFNEPGVLERIYAGPLGDASGADRLKIRLYDLLAHGWDLAQATGQNPELPSDAVEDSLAFVQIQLATQSRSGRFNEAQTTDDHAPALDRLVAFLGRSVEPS